MPRISRKEEAREPVAEAVDIQWIPPHFKQRMADEGFTLRWIRFTEGNETIDRYLNRRIQTGWEFVRPDEVKDEWKLAPTLEHGRLGSVITSMDTVLMKRPEELSRREQAASEKKAKDMADAVKNNLRSSNARLDQYTPLSDESRQRTTTGGRQTKFGE